MTEADYFLRLEGRVSAELRGMREAALRRFWCDGFMPERNLLSTSGGCHVAGKVWMADGDRDKRLWNFVLLLGPAVVPRDEVKWSELLPAQDETGWLSLDFENNFVKIRPRDAHTDRDVPAS